MLKKLPVFILLFVLFFAVFTQVKSSHAFHVPITGPLTSPITAPLTSANLFGKVMYKQLGRLFGNAQRLIPVQGVKITIQGFFNNNQKYTTSTDSTGTYALRVPNGMYTIRVEDGHNTLYAPPLRVATVKNKTQEVNFQGLLFPTFGR